MIWSTAVMGNKIQGWLVCVVCQKMPSRQSFIHREVNIRRENSSSTIRNDLPSVCLYKFTFIFDFLFFHPAFPLWFCSDMDGLWIILSNFVMFSFLFIFSHSLQFNRDRSGEGVPRETIRGTILENAQGPV